MVVQNTMLRTEDWETQTLLKIEGELRCHVRVSSSCSTGGTISVTVKCHEHHNMEIVLDTSICK